MTAELSHHTKRPFSVIPESIYTVQPAAEKALSQGSPELPESPESLKLPGSPESLGSLEERLAYVEAAIRREQAQARPRRAAAEQSPLYQQMQEFVDGLYEAHSSVDRARLDIVVAAESAELPPELLEIVELLPPGSYTRARLCAQLNSAIGARAWGRRFGVLS